MTYDSKVGQKEDFLTRRDTHEFGIDRDLHDEGMDWTSVYQYKEQVPSINVSGPPPLHPPEEACISVISACPSVVVYSSQ